MPKMSPQGMGRYIETTIYEDLKVAAKNMERQQELYDRYGDGEEGLNSKVAKGAQLEVKHRAYSGDDPEEAVKKTYRKD